jgi:3-deoxy-manno-octulosonate cytidylyltransferase (CMP-KDO synthetase)
MKITAVIPARYASTRFAGKPLADILGKPMIQWVYERTVRASLVSETIVATDDERIAAVVRRFGGRVEMTSADHETGTDRLAEVASRLDAELIVNVQGDEPLIEPAMIDGAIAPLVADSTIPMGTLMARITSRDDLENPNIVKVVTDGAGCALYFSRSPIPHLRDEGGMPDEAALVAGHYPFFRHIGLYVFRRDFLLNFARLAQTPLEKMEKLEQLRALEHGFRIRVEETRHDSIGVDTPADLQRVIDRLK